MAILKPNKVSIKKGVTVNEYLLIGKYPGKIRNKVIGVTIHNTDWISTALGTTPAEQYTRATLNGNMGDVIVHYYVDDKCAWQNLPHNIHGWHAADGDGDGNFCTIAIECIMDGSGSERSVKSEDNAARLAAAILKEFGLGIEQLYTHQHWYSKKYCPAYILPHWETFKRKVQGYLGDGSAEPVELYRIRKSWDDFKSQIGAYSKLEGAKQAWKDGYIIYNSKGEQVFPELANSLNEPEPITLPNLKKGDTGNYVESLQCLLIGKGISCGASGIDHIFGEKTEEGVKDLQHRVKLKETGVCDSKTWESLFKY